MSNVLITQGTETYIATDTVGTADYQVIKLDVGAAGASSPFTGTVGVNALPNIPGGTIGVVSQITNGSIVMTAGTVAAHAITAATITEGTLRNLISGTINSATVTGNIGMSSGTLNVATISTLPNIPGGSIVVTAGTVAAHAITAATITEGTLRNLMSGTINSATITGNVGVSSGTINVSTISTLPNIPGGTLGVLSSLTTGSISNVALLHAGTITSIGTILGIGGTVTTTATGGTFTAGTINTGTINTGTIDLLQAGTITSLLGGSVVVTAGTVTTTMGDLSGGTIDLLSAGTISMINAGTITSVGTVPGIGILTAGTISMINAGTLTNSGTTTGVGVVSMLSAGTLSMINAGTLTSVGTNVGVGTVTGLGTCTTVTTVSNLTNGSVRMTIGTITTGSLTNVALLNAGTISMINAGTLTSSGTTTGVGTVTGLGTCTTVTTVSNVTNGSIVMTVGTVTHGTIDAGTVKLDGRTARNILSYGTTFGGTAAGYATLVGSAVVGAGTSIWMNELSIINSKGGTVTGLIGFGTVLNGTSVLAKGDFGPQGGIQKSYPLPVNAGMTNNDLVAYIGAAGTLDFNVSYFISA